MALSKNSSKCGMSSVRSKRFRESVSSDSDSDSEVRMKASQSGIPNGWARFLVLKGVNELDDVCKMSPFLVSKWFQGMAPSGIKDGSIKKLRYGGYLLECLNERTSVKLQTLKDPIINDVPVKISPHDALNSSKGVFRCRDLQGISDPEICQELAGQGVKPCPKIEDHPKFQEG